MTLGNDSICSLSHTCNRDSQPEHSGVRPLHTGTRVHSQWPYWHSHCPKSDRVSLWGLHVLRIIRCNRPGTLKHCTCTCETIKTVGKSTSIRLAAPIYVSCIAVHPLIPAWGMASSRICSSTLAYIVHIVDCLNNFRQHIL